MVKSHHRAIVSCWIGFLIAFLHTLSHVCVDGRQIFDDSNFRPKPNGSVKSIEVPEDGDVIDCILFHKQPAFDHAHIKDLQVFPEIKNDKKYPELYQNWHKYGECPNGSVPIRRTSNDDVHIKASYGEYAIVAMPYKATYQGADASISLWNPKVEAGEFSLARVSVQAGDHYTGTFTALEAGWIIYPKRYHDSQSRLFVHWTTESYKVGCFDLDCPGFVQLDPKFVIGVPIKPTSAYNGSTLESTFAIYKSHETGNWNFKFQGVLLGYWPASIVPLLLDHAEAVEWGGEILNNVNNNHHTTTQMGNGQFSKEVNSKEVNLKAAYIRDLHILNKDYVLEPTTNLQTGDPNSNCYDVTIGNIGTIYYGGSGYSQRCNFTLTD